MHYNIINRKVYFSKFLFGLLALLMMPVSTCTKYNQVIEQNTSTINFNKQPSKISSIFSLVFAQFNNKQQQSFFNQQLQIDSYLNKVTFEYKKQHIKLFDVIHVNIQIYPKIGNTLSFKNLIFMPTILSYQNLISQNISIRAGPKI